MKKSVLLFVGLLLTAVSAIAQPAKPQVAFSTWTEGEFYLYNVEAGMFLTNGNAWGARATMVTGGSNDNIINYDKFMAGQGDVDAIKWEIKAADDTRGLTGENNYCYIIHNTKDASFNLTVTTAKEGWVDAGPGRPETEYEGWYIASKDDVAKTFKLSYIRKNEKKDGEGQVIENEYEYEPMTGTFCVSKLADGNFDTFYDETGINDTWAVVSVAEYNNVIDGFKLYYAGERLKTMIADAKALGINADFSAYETTLNNPESTLKDLQDAFNKLKPAVEFGKVIVEAKQLDADRWGKFETIFADPESTDAIFETNTKLIRALIDLKTALDEGKALDADHDYTKAEGLYASDESALADIEAETTRVKAFVSLKKALVEAIDKNCNVDEYALIYANTDAETTALAEAEAKVKDLIDAADIAAAIATATVDNPADLTNYITNPTFDKEGDFTGWTAAQGSAGFGAAGETSTNAEVFGAQFEVYQDVKNLPAGVYMLANNGYLRLNNSVDQDYAAWSSGQVSETKMYLESPTKGKFFTPVKFISAGGSRTSLGVNELNTKAQDADGEYTLYTPNTMKAADHYFHNTDDPNRYRNEAYGALAEGETLRIGVMNDKAAGASWSIFDDFQLFFVGNGLDAYKKWAESAIKNYNIKFDGNIYYGKSEKENFETIISTLENSNDTQEIADQLLNLDKAAEAIELSKANYATYVATLEGAQTWLEENFGDNDSYYKLSDYMDATEELPEYPNGPARVIIPDYLAGGYEGILSAEDIATETEYLKGLLADAVKNTLSNGSDLTDLIKNADFSLSKSEQDWQGWTKNAASGGNVRVAESCAEAWNNSNFDIYQEVEGLPEGLYEISVQGFYRYGRGQYEAYTAQNVPEVKPGGAPVFVYMNNMSTPFANVYSEPQGTGFYTSGGTEAQGDNYFPNDMASAAVAFNNGMYTQKAYGLIQAGDVMRIGVKGNSSQLGDSWVIFDSFKLSYRAKDPTAIMEVLKMKREELKNLIAEARNNNNITEPVYKDANGIANTTIDDNLSNDAKYEILIETNDAIVASRENIEKVEAYKAIYTKYDEAADALELVDPSCEDDIWDDIDNIDDEAEGYGDLNTDELADLTTRIEQLTTDILAKVEEIKVANKVEDMASATDDQPYDATSFIKNPDMEEAADSKTMPGWEFWIAHWSQKEGKTDADKANGPVKGSDGISGRSLEAWSGTVGADLDFHAFQTLASLPAGKYVLTAKAANASNGVTADENLWNNPETAAAGRVYFYTLISDGENERAVSIPVEPNIGSATAANTYELTFTLAEGEEATIGFQTVGTVPFRWFMCDDFGLMYYGTQSSKTDSTDEGDVVAIEEVEEMAAGKTIAGIYTASGVQIEALQPGVNIVKYTDGTSRKIFK